MTRLLLFACAALALSSLLFVTRGNYKTLDCTETTYHRGQAR